MSDKHYYIWYRLGRSIIYERTVSSEHYADERVGELRKRGKEAWWTTDVLNGSFY
jgi:hypothetical protein